MRIQVLHQPQEGGYARISAVSSLSCEAHNQRLIPLENVLSDKSCDNEQVIYSSIADTLERGRKMYSEVHGRALGAKSSPIMEIVMELPVTGGMDNALGFAKAWSEHTGWSVIQAYVHRDEGTINPKTSQWEPHVHAHILFDRICYEHRLMQVKAKPGKGESGTVLADMYGCLLPNDYSYTLMVADYANAYSSLERVNSDNGLRIPPDSYKDILMEVQMANQKYITIKEQILSISESLRRDLEISLKECGSESLSRSILQQIDALDSLSVERCSSYSLYNAITGAMDVLSQVRTDSLESLYESIRKECRLLLEGISAMPAHEIVSPTVREDVQRIAASLDSTSSLSKLCSYLQTLQKDYVSIGYGKVRDYASECQQIRREMSFHSGRPAFEASVLRLLDHVGLGSGYRDIKRENLSLADMVDKMEKEVSSLKERISVLDRRCSRSEKMNDVHMASVRRLEESLKEVSEKLLKHCPEPVIEALMDDGLADLLGHDPLKKGKRLEPSSGMALG